MGRSAPGAALRHVCVLALVLLLLGSSLIAHAAPPLTLSVSLSTDRPALGSDLVATVVAFGGSGDVAVALDLPAGLEGPTSTTLHATPVGLVVVTLHVRSDAAVGVRGLVFRVGAQMVRKQIFVGQIEQPPPRQLRYLPLIRR